MKERERRGEGNKAGKGKRAREEEGKSRRLYWQNPFVGVSTFFILTGQGTFGKHLFLVEWRMIESIVAHKTAPLFSFLGFLSGVPPFLLSVLLLEGFVCLYDISARLDVVEECITHG